MKSKRLVLVITIIPLIAITIYLVSLLRIPYGEECSIAVSPQFHRNCEVNILGSYLFNPLLKCNSGKVIIDDMVIYPKEGGRGICDYRWSN